MERIKAVFLTAVEKEGLIRTTLDEGILLKAIILPFKAKSEDRLQAVKELALTEGIPLLRPKQSELCEILKNLKPDLLISSGYPYILTEQHLSLVKYRINIHPTLLPKYRGAATTWYIIANGDSEGGVTIHSIDSGMDTGPIIEQGAFPLGPFDTLKSYMRKANALEPVLLSKALAKITRGQFSKLLQDEELASTYPALRTPEDSRIETDKSIHDLYNFIRACDPDRFPAFFEIEGQKVGVKFFRLEKPDAESDMI